MSGTKMSARERIASLLDVSSFVEIGANVTSRSTDFNMPEKETPADGVITGYGVIDGNLVYVYSQDATVLGGSIGEMHSKKISKIYDLAMKVGAPVIGLIDCAGLRLQEATDGLNSFGELFSKQAMASGVIPQITVLFGNCGGGTALIPALTDFTFMTKENAALFVNSPNALEGNYKEKLDTASAEYHATTSGLVDVVGESEEEVLSEVRTLVSALPACNEEDGAFEECTDDLNRIVADLEAYPHDARYILSSVSDNGFFFETKKDFAKGMVTGFIKLNGSTIGCVANQLSDGEQELAPELTVDGAAKAMKFVSFCDAFNIPILSVTNVKGLKATVCEEKRIAKAVAKLTYAFSSATVPKVNLVVGESFGTAYIAMNSKSIGADLEFAWPTAKIGMMDAKEAANIMYSGESADVIAQKASEYDALQTSVESAAKRGYVDDIIVPDATRKRLIAAFEMLFTKQVSTPNKKHGTV